MAHMQIYKAVATVNSKERRQEGKDYQDVSLIGYNDWDEFIKDMQDHFSSRDIIVLATNNVPHTYVEKRYCEATNSVNVSHIDGLFFDMLKAIEDWDEEKKDAFCAYCEEVLEKWDIATYWNNEGNKQRFETIDAFDDIYCGMFDSEEDFCEEKFRDFYPMDKDIYDAIHSYIDFHKMARDWFDVDKNYSWADGYVFDNDYRVD